MRASPLFVPYRRPGEAAASASDEPPTLGHLDDDEDADATPQAEAPEADDDDEDVPYGASYGESYGASRGYAYRDVDPVDTSDALSNVSWNDTASMMSEQSRPPSPTPSSVAGSSPSFAPRPSEGKPSSLDLNAAHEANGGDAASAVRRSAAAKLADAQEAMRAARERAGSLLQQR
jgi:hypothetical protein